MGDTYPNQILDPIVRVYLYRWPHKPSAKERDYTVHPHRLLFGSIVVVLSDG